MPTQPAIIVDRTPPPKLLYYSDTRFYADLKRHRKALDKLARQAVRDYRRGRTRRFPL